MPKVASKPLFDRLLANLTKEEIISIMLLAEHNVMVHHEERSLSELKSLMKKNQEELTQFTITIVSRKLQSELQNVSD